MKPKSFLLLDYNTVPELLSGHSLITLLRHLDPGKYRTIAVFNRAGAYTEQASRFVETRIVPYGGGNLFTRAWQYGCLFPSLWNLVRREQPSLIYANNVMAGRTAVILKTLTGLPVLVHIRNVGLFARTAPFVLRADKFLAVSRATAQGTLPPQLAHRADVVYDGIELAEYPFADSDLRRASRRKLGLPADAYIVGMAGRLVAQKGQQDFLEVAKRISAQRNDVYFVHAGGEPRSESSDTYERTLADESSALVVNNRFKWLPYIDEMHTFWSALDVAVVPSAGPEAFSRAVIEAMASGTPVIATRCGGPEEIIDDSNTGLLVSMAAPEALAGAMMQLLGDAELRGRMATRARRAVEERFSAERYAARIAEVFDQVAFSHTTSGSAVPGGLTGRDQ